MEKNCLFCGCSYKKPINESMKNWIHRHKYCSRVCCDKAKKGVRNNSKTKFSKGDPRLVGNKLREGLSPVNKGISPSDETRRKISIALTGRPTGRTGERCHFWKGGKTKKRAAFMNSQEYKNWRRSLLERDNYQCVNCGDRNHDDHKVTLDAHHIQSMSNFPEKKLDISNGMILCRACHRQTDNFGRLAVLTGK